MKSKAGALAVMLLVTAAVAQDTLPTDSGVYYISSGRYTLMKRACNTGMKAMGFGVRGKFVYENASAPIQVNDHRPVFVFIGADQHSNVRQSFALVAMNMKKKNREVEFAAGGVIKNQLEAKVTNEASSIKVVPVVDLTPGEYLLGMYQGANDATIANLLGCGFDFSVK